MNFNKIIFAAAAVFACSFVCASAQQLPQQHTQAADQYLNMLSSDTFIEKAFAMSRVDSPIEVVETAPHDIDMAVADGLVEYAARFLGTRYSFGAAGPKAFDCSGFTGYIYKSIGVKLHRSSSEQYTQGTRVKSIAEMKPGDLMFFSSSRSGRRGVGHVGMVVSVDAERGTCRFIHASTKKGVVYQDFPDGAYYSKHYVGARRIL